MSAKRTPGQALVESLARQLPANMEFDESETAVLELIAQATDRLAAASMPAWAMGLIAAST